MGEPAVPHRCRDCYLNQSNLEKMTAEPEGALVRVTISFLVDPHALVEASTGMIRTAMDQVRRGNTQAFPIPVPITEVDDPA